jgi:prevent-host-death family protein
MRNVSVYEAKTHLSALLDAVAAGAEIIVTRHGKPVARITAVAPAKVARVPGDLRIQPGWENFVYDPDVFRAMTEEEVEAEGWNG